MTTRTCVRGQLRLEVQGDSLGGGICHCLTCQRRTGSVFATLAAFDPQFPPPADSVYDCRRHPWVQLPPGITVFERDAP